MNRQSQDHQNQSDNDEGFIPSKIIIKEKKQLLTNKQTNKNQNAKEFIGRYISDGIMRYFISITNRKEPPQCYSRFSRFDFIENTDSRKSIPEEELNLFPQNLNYASICEVGEQARNNSEFRTIEGDSSLKQRIKEKLLTPYDKYLKSGDYFLVYSRYKDFKFSNEQINFASNQIRLDCLRSLDEVKFKPIKPFELIQEKQEQILTQNMNRYGSIREVLLQFDSKFECGNLLCAFKHKKQLHAYTLFIQNDTNTYGYNQWFYFSIKNAQTNIKYKFSIVNFRKRHSFFKEGNKPVIFSLLDSKKQGMSGYSKRGTNVQYRKSPIMKSYDSKQKFFQLSFEMEFNNDEDLYYLSMGLPYSYSKLINNLNTYGNLAKSNGVHWSLQNISNSVAGNQIPLLTITKIETEDQAIQKIKFCKSYREGVNQDENLQEQDELERQQRSKYNSTQFKPSKHKKRVLFFVARQHPGETWSSYLMDEFLYGLASQSGAQAKYLVDNFIIKCIPMINVDGVIFGNFRCDLTGMDLNRNWKAPSSLLHPQIYAIKNQIITLTQNNYQIQSFIDFHGHSKQYNVFCYSCKTDNYQCRLLPYIFYELNEQFYFPFCTFGISRYKQHTARAVIFQIVKNTNVLTVQSSFFGSNINGKMKIFQPHTFQKMAQTLIKGCKSYFSHDGHYQACKQIVRMRMSEFLQAKGQNNNALSGSDSQPSQDEIDLREKIQQIIPKNLIEEVIQMQSLKKSPKKPKKNIKRQTLQAPMQNTSYKIKKLGYNSQSKNRTIDVVKDESPAKEVKINWETIKRRKIPLDETKTNSFRNKSIIMSNQAILQSELSGNDKRIFLKDVIKEEHKLPFFTREKPQMIPMKLKNQSYEIFRDAYNATEKQIKNMNETSSDELRKQKRNNSKKLGIFRQKFQKEDEFPLLCVLSQNKKKSHAQKFKLKKEGKQVDKSKDQTGPQKNKTAIQTRTQAIKQLRQKNKNSMELVSKIWRQNFTRYGMAFSTFKITK